MKKDDNKNKNGVNIDTLSLLTYACEKGLKFEYDEVKSRSNEEKHGIDFETAKEIWEGPYFKKPRQIQRGTTVRGCGQN